MKKIMLLLILAFCLPSLGDILVYQMTWTPNAMTINDGIAQLDKRPFSGYLIIDVDTNTPGAEPNNVALFLYQTSTKVKVDATAGLLFDSNMVDTSNTNFLTFIHLADSNVWDFNAVMIGSTKPNDVGMGKNDKRAVAASLKGSAVFFSDPFGNNISEIGSASVTAKLQSKMTKSANKNEDDFNTVATNIFNNTLSAFNDITP